MRRAQAKHAPAVLDEAGSVVPGDPQAGPVVPHACQVKLVALVLAQFLRASQPLFGFVQQSDEGQEESEQQVGRDLHLVCLVAGLLGHAGRLAQQGRRLLVPVEAMKQSTQRQQDPGLQGGRPVIADQITGAFRQLARPLILDQPVERRGFLQQHVGLSERVVAGHRQGARLGQVGQRVVMVSQPVAHDPPALPHLEPALVLGSSRLASARV